MANRQSHSRSRSRLRLVAVLEMKAKADQRHPRSHSHCMVLMMTRKVVQVALMVSWKSCETTIREGGATGANRQLRRHRYCNNRHVVHFFSMPDSIRSMFCNHHYHKRRHHCSLHHCFDCTQRPMVAEQVGQTGVLGCLGRAMVEESATEAGLCSIRPIVRSC